MNRGWGQRQGPIPGFRIMQPMKRTPRPAVRFRVHATSVAVGAALALIPALLPGCQNQGQISGIETPPAVPDRLSGVCEVQGDVAFLDRAVDESSGILRSRLHPGVYWTHNDSGGTSELFALDRQGRLLGRVRVPGVPNRDWEDLAYGPCGSPGEAPGLPPGERQRCLWIGEFGDNAQTHDTVYLYQIPEPHPSDTATGAPLVYPFVYADGPRDAEALFFDAEDRAWVVSKGRPIADPAGTHPPRGDGRITVYRLRTPLHPGTPAVAEPVQVLSASPPPRDLRVTAGASSPSGQVITLRTYVDLQFYRIEADTLRALLSGRGVDLRPLGEPQGEGVDLDDDGTVVLSSEAGASAPGVLHQLRCALGSAP